MKRGGNIDIAAMFIWHEDEKCRVSVPADETSWDGVRGEIFGAVSLSRSIYTPPAGHCGGARIA